MGAEIDGVLVESTVTDTLLSRSQGGDPGIHGRERRLVAGLWFASTPTHGEVADGHDHHNRRP